MAKAKAAAAGAAKAGGKQSAKKKKKTSGKKGIGSTFFFVLFIIGLMAVKPAVALVAAIGLAPTMVAVIVETGQFRGVRVRTIFAFNLAGVIPFVFKYWLQSDLEALLRDFTELWLFIVMYGAAAAGMLILWIAPLIVATMVQMANQEKIKKINKTEDQLVEEWGPKVNQLEP